MRYIGKKAIIMILIMMITTNIPQSNSLVFTPISSHNDTGQHTYSTKNQIAEQIITEWIDDCSDITTFPGRGDDTWPHDSVVSVVFGSIDCSGNYFYSDDVGSGTGHHGPLYYHALITPINLSQFVELQAEIEISGSSAGLTAWIRIGLHAADNASLLTLQVADSWTGAQAAYANLIYKYDNGTLTETPNSYPEYAASEPYHETFGVLNNETGLCTSFPRIPNQVLLDRDEVELSREIMYISIQFGGYSTWPLCETMRIHNLMLRYEPTEASQTTTSTETTTETSETDTAIGSTSTTTPNSSGTTHPEYPDLLLIISIGSGGTIVILVLVIIILSRRTENAIQ